MKSVRVVAISLVFLMLFSVLGTFSNEVVPINEETIELEEEKVLMEATSPGHPVFAEYMGAYWCGPCVTASNNLDALYGTNGGGGSTSEDFTFISFWESSSTGWPSDGPINRRSHIQNAPGYTGGIPVVVFGDADQGTYYTVGGQSYDSFYQNGGDTQSGTDYSLAIVQSENGNNMDIEITATYTGAGSKTVSLYAAVTEEVSPESYSAGSQYHPHHVWKKWLLNGASTGFESITLSSGNSVSKSWSVPISTVRAGGGNTAADNFLTVAALLDGDHTTHRNLVSAADSNMAPLIDVGVSNLVVTNPGVDSGYVNGDILNLQATVSNNGIDAYTDGGDVRFYHKTGNTKSYVGSTQSLSNFASTGATQTFSGQIDTSSIPESNYQTTFGVELSNLVMDSKGSNNDETNVIPHDLIPVSRKSQVIGDNQIERGQNFRVEAKATYNDGVDTDITSYTFDVEYSPAGMDQWSDVIVESILDSNGEEEVYNLGTANEHKEYLLKPTMLMSAGDYDLRIRAIDARGQISDWQVSEGGFALKNAMPTISSDPVPTVKVQTQQKVSVSANIMDAESPGDISGLTVTSTSPNFIAWHPVTEEIEVYFENIRYVQGNPTPSGIEVAVSDGTDTSYGTLLFNVIENGQPRWAGVEKQYVNEDSVGSIDLLAYLTDTDSSGNIASAEDLVLAVIDNTNPEIIDVELREFTLNFETADPDVNGETTITVRASDGEQYSDQIITIAINPVNDAPRLDLTAYEGLRLKVGEQKVIFLNEILTDVDGDTNQVIISASNPVPGAARVNFLDNTLTMFWEDAGLQTVTIQVEDRYDSNIYTLVIDVYDSTPLLVGQGPDADVTVSVSNVYVDEIASVTMFLNKADVTITSLETTWQLCNELTGVCTINNPIQHDITMKSVGWTFDPFTGQIDDIGLRMKDQIKLSKVVAISSDGSKFEFKDPIYWTANEAAPVPDSTWDEQLVIDYLVDLEIEIEEKELQISELEEGSDQHTAAMNELVMLNEERESACQFTKCIDESQSSNTPANDGESGTLNLTVILSVLAVVIIGLLVGLLFMRSGNNNEQGSNDMMVDWANALPATDVVANSMYGGAQDIFQQPVATPVAQPAPVAPPAAALPLPPGGLPAGWTMEQWAYYGHQYQQ